MNRSDSKIQPNRSCSCIRHQGAVFRKVAPFDNEAPRAWVFSDHVDCLSTPCPPKGVELELSTAPEEGRSCGGIGDGGELIACSSRQWERGDSSADARININVTTGVSDHNDLGVPRPEKVGPKRGKPVVSDVQPPQSWSRHYTQRLMLRVPILLQAHRSGQLVNQAAHNRLREVIS
jgi:hypothetical protein